MSEHLSSSSFNPWTKCGYLAEKRRNLREPTTSSVQHVDGEGGPEGDGDARSRELPHQESREEARRARHVYLVQD